MDRILPFFDPPLRGQFLYLERGQKHTFFDPLPPHLVHVVIKWPLIPTIRKDRIYLRVSPNVVMMFVVNMVQTSNRANPKFSIIKFFCFKQERVLTL